MATGPKQPRLSSTLPWTGFYLGLNGGYSWGVQRQFLWPGGDD